MAKVQVKAVGATLFAEADAAAGAGASAAGECAS